MADPRHVKMLAELDQLIAHTPDPGGPDTEARFRRVRNTNPIVGALYDRFRAGSCSEVEFLKAAVVFLSGELAVSAGNCRRTNRESWEGDAVTRDALLAAVRATPPVT